MIPRSGWGGKKLLPSRRQVHTSLTSYQLPKRKASSSHHFSRGKLVVTLQNLCPLLKGKPIQHTAKSVPNHLKMWGCFSWSWLTNNGVDFPTKGMFTKTKKHLYLVLQTTHFQWMELVKRPTFNVMIWSLPIAKPPFVKCNALKIPLESL